MSHLPSATILIPVSIFLLSHAAAMRKSEEKCHEYAKLVYEKEESPVLFGTRYNVVSRCEILETPLIIGGVQAKSAEFPHMAAIGFGKGEDVSWQCGGTIISESYILTAAHCLESRDKGPATVVRVGMTDLLNPEGSMQQRNISVRLKHPDYKRPVKYHDIALLKLDSPLALNPTVRPACLQLEEKLRGKSAIASGFGKTAYDASEGSTVLMKVQLDLISKRQCKKAFWMEIGKRHMPRGLIHGLLCAGVMQGGKDTCQGDSGGPLQMVLEDPYCMYAVIGITSFGKFCAFKNSPAIYTRVSSYLDWIESVVWP